MECRNKESAESERLYYVYWYQICLILLVLKKLVSSTKCWTPTLLVAYYFRPVNGSAS